VARVVTKKLEYSLDSDKMDRGFTDGLIYFKSVKLEKVTLASDSSPLVVLSVFQTSRIEA
jgi:hypothetical protein